MGKALVYDIVEKARRGDLQLVGPQDFVLAEADAVSLESILVTPNLTPYCFDAPNHRLLLVQTDPRANLLESPFFYQAQYRHACRVYAISYSDLNRLAACLPDPDNLILLHSTGRCGSTLLSNAFNQVENVVSLSEPDFFTQVAFGRLQGHLMRMAAAVVLRSCFRLLCRPHDRTWVVKFRSQATDVADVIQMAAPHARSIFMYRNAISVVESYARVYRKAMKDSLKASSLSVDPILDCWAEGVASQGSTSRYLLESTWLRPMQRYMELQSAGFWACALRYEELTAEPRRILEKLFDRCGIPSAQVEAALLAFQSDSQAASSLSRESLQALDDGELPRESIEELRGYLRQVEGLSYPDVVVPGSLLVA